MATQKNLANEHDNLISDKAVIAATPAGPEMDFDGIDVTVHASDDEFEVDSNVEVESSDSEGEQPKQGTNRPRSEVVISEKTWNYIELQKMLKDNPALQDVVNDIVDQRFQQRQSESQDKSDKEKDQGKSVEVGIQSAPRNPQQLQNVQNTPCNIQPNSRHVKSPSDTTIYTPALKQGATNVNMINQISDFVETI